MCILYGEVVLFGHTINKDAGERDFTFLEMDPNPFRLFLTRTSGRIFGKGQIQKINHGVRQGRSDDSIHHLHYNMVRPSIERRLRALADEIVHYEDGIFHPFGKLHLDLPWACGRPGSFGHDSLDSLVWNLEFQASIKVVDATGGTQLSVAKAAVPFPKQPCQVFQVGLPRTWNQSMARRKKHEAHVKLLENYQKRGQKGKRGESIHFGYNFQQIFLFSSSTM
jgi:hypothetical protein